MAIVSTAAMTSDATNHVDPQSNANWMIDLVSSSMNAAPSRNISQDQRPAWPRRVAITATVDTTRMSASAPR